MSRLKFISHMINKNQTKKKKKMKNNIQSSRSSGRNSSSLRPAPFIRSHSKSVNIYVMHRSYWFWRVIVITFFFFTSFFGWGGGWRKSLLTSLTRLQWKPLIGFCWWWPHPSNRPRNVHILPIRNWLVISRGYSNELAVIHPLSLSPSLGYGL